MKQPHQNETTHFGYQQVNADEKEALVGQVFDSVAPRYDLMNDVMSLGIHRLWKRFTIAKSGVRQGDCVLDVAGGTGDLTAAFSKRVGKQGHVILGDINNAMLKVGRSRLENQNIIDNVQFTELNAECLPFSTDTFDVISIAFGLRNVTNIPSALESMYRVLKPGGRLLVLEFSTPTVNWLKPLYDKYSFSVLPTLGKWLAKDSDSYQYLAESIRMHPDQDTLKSLFLNAGFDDCHYHNLTGGITALHVGIKH